MEIINSLLAAVQIDRSKVNLPTTSLSPSSVTEVLKVVFGFAGAVALLIITIGGLKYVLSQGNPQETAKAKDTILYALIGLVVCMFAWSIINFVIEKL